MFPAKHDKTVDTKQNDDQKKINAAIKIQSHYRGYISRKKTNIQGKSQGKEIEVYLPLAVRKRDTGAISYENMVGGYKSILCRSDLFYLQLDRMNFISTDTGYVQKVYVIEIVTVPFKQSNEEKSNLIAEKQIDHAIKDFLKLLQGFTQNAAVSQIKSHLILDDLLSQYNKLHPRHPLIVPELRKKYLQNPISTALGKPIRERKHENVDICLIYDPNFTPRFDTHATPRTAAALTAVQDNQYKSGKLLIHVQLTFALPLQNYRAAFIPKEFHNTPQQLAMLQEAQTRSEKFLVKHPLPATADKEKILGLLIVCVEHILTLTKATEYGALHEKADRPVLSMRHILHYVKKNVCNAAELQWFDIMFRDHYQDIKTILCVEAYVPDYRGHENAYGRDNSSDRGHRYDVIFDLFGDFANKKEFSHADEKNEGLVTNMTNYGIGSWAALYSNHFNLSCRTHLLLQPVGTEYWPLFEARRIGLITIDDFNAGSSSVPLPGNNVKVSGVATQSTFGIQETLDVDQKACMTRFTK